MTHNFAFFQILEDDLNIRFETGYFKYGTTAIFLKKNQYLPQKWMNECPFFFEKTIHRGTSKKIHIFPLAVPPPDILPPK